MEAIVIIGVLIFIGYCFEDSKEEKQRKEYIKKFEAEQIKRTEQEEITRKHKAKMVEGDKPATKFFEQTADGYAKHGNEYQGKLENEQSLILTCLFLLISAAVILFANESYVWAGATFLSSFIFWGSLKERETRLALLPDAIKFYEQKIDYSFNKYKSEIILDKDENSNDTNPHFMTSEEIGAAGLLTGTGIPLGQTLDGKPMHYKGGLHLMTIAPNGSWKHSAVQGNVLIEYDAPIVMIDPKGEAAIVTAKSRRDLLGHEVHILNPFGVLEEHFTAQGFTSSRFNPLAALDPASKNFTGDIAALGEALILTEGKDPYFDNTARDLVVCLMMYVCTEETETPTLPRVRQLLTDDEKSFHETLLLMADSDFAPLAQKARTFLKDTKGNDGIISTARTQTSFLDDPCLSENLSGSDFRFLDLKKKKITVYIVLPAKMVFTYSRWFRLLVTSGLDELMSTQEKGEKPVLFMLDEAPVLGHLSSIETAFGLARGFGVQLWPFFQDKNQLDAIYKDRANSFFANSGLHQYFTPNDLTTAEHISQRCGEITSVSTSTNYGQNVNIGEGERKERLYSAHSLLSMPENEQLLFIAKHSNPIKAAKVRYFKNPEYNRRFMKNPYV